MSEAKTREERARELRIACERCSGSGKRETTGFFSAAEMDANLEPRTIERSCYLCHGKGWVLPPQDDLAAMVIDAQDEIARLKEESSSTVKYMAGCINANADAIAVCAQEAIKLKEENARLCTELAEMTKNRDQWERNASAENQRAGDLEVAVRRLRAELAQARVKALEEAAKAQCGLCARADKHADKHKVGTHFTPSSKEEGQAFFVHRWFEDGEWLDFKSCAAHPIHALISGTQKESE